MSGAREIKRPRAVDIAPRVLTAEEAAIYCGFRSPRGGAFARWLERVGVEPMPGRAVAAYDRIALDRAISCESGVGLESDARPVSSSIGPVSWSR